MRVDNILEYKMYVEYVEVLDLVVDVVCEIKVVGYRVIVVGIMFVCLLELVVKVVGDELIVLFYVDMDIFIYFGFNFKVVDVMFINFYLLEFMLMMLISVFVGKEYVMLVY